LVWFDSVRATKVTIWAGLASINERVDRSGLINEHIHVWFGADTCPLSDLDTRTASTIHTQKYHRKPQEYVTGQWTQWVTKPYHKTPIINNSILQDFLTTASLLQKPTPNGSVIIP